MKLYISIAGLLLLGAVGCQMEHHGHEEGEHEENEVKVSFGQIPVPVQATLTKEAEGVMITSVGMEKEHGQTVYEADAMIGGANYEIKVDSTGRLISKKLDDEKAESESKKSEKGEDKD